MDSVSSNQKGLRAESNHDKLSYFEMSGDAGLCWPHSVRFAAPFDLMCDKCHLVVESGFCFSALKTGRSSCSTSCFIQWNFESKCPRCGAEFRFRQRSHADEYQVIGASKWSRTSKNGFPQECLMVSPVSSEDVAKRKPQCLAQSARRSKAIESELARVRKDRQWGYVDTAKTADVLLAHHKKRWSNTPLRALAHSCFAVPDAKRKSAREAHRIRRSRTRSKTILAQQKSRTGGLKANEFLKTRKAVRHLHRSGALDNVLKSSLSGIKRNETPSSRQCPTIASGKL